MDYSALLKKRRSIRFYQQKPVAEKHLVKMVQAALHAPSAANNQVLRYTIIRNQEVVSGTLIFIEFHNVFHNNVLINILHMYPAFRAMQDTHTSP